MEKMTLKTKLIMFGFIIAFMFSYMILFGNQNSVIGVMIAMAASMNLGNDLSYKPKVSFIRILILLLVLGIAAFLNNPITIFGCILTFFVVFGTTFTSYHMFGTSVYLPFLMCYFMMMCIPVSIEQLPMRLIALIIGAIFIVGLNLLVNRKKEYKLTKSTINNLSQELIHSIDLKLNGKRVYKENFKIANNFYLSLFSKFQYKYFPNSTQKSTLTIIKAFQYIGYVLAEYEFSDNELNHIKYILKNIENINSDKIFNEVQIENNELYLILLNLEIIAVEVKNKDLTKEYIIPDKNTVKKLIKPILKKSLSFKSAKFVFAFKMAIILTLWEILTLIFNLPFTKWLYFSSIPLMLPYINDMAKTAITRIKGTLIGVFIFALIIILMPFIPLEASSLIMIVLVVCIFGMVYKMEDKLEMTIFTTIMSVMVSLMYIAPPEAIILKILWIVVAVIGVSIINFGFLPYSVEKETNDNLKNSLNLNEQSITIIKNKCMGKSVSNESNLVVTNIIRENIEITDDNIELYELQGKIADITNFIINYLDIHEFSNNLKEELICIINGGENFRESNDVYENVMLYSTRYIVKLLNEEEKLINHLN